MELLLSLLPILLLIYLMVKGLPAAKALPLVALLAYILKLSYFQFAAATVHAAVLNGLLTAFTPISIVFGAIFLFLVMEKSGCIAIIKESLDRVTDSRIAHVMIIGWAFSFLLEGASGFGTPAAIVAPILVGLGFHPLKVAIFALMMNTVPVSFGAVGTPIWFGLSALDLSEASILSVSIKTAWLQFFAGLAIPVLALSVLFPFREIKKNSLYIILSILSCLVPYVVIAYFSFEFPSLFAGAIGLALSALLGKLIYGSSQSGAGQYQGADYFRGYFPLLGTVVLLLLTRIPALGIKALLLSEYELFRVDVFGAFQLALSPALVISLSDILGVDASIGQFEHALLYVPSIIPFVLVGMVFLLLVQKDRRLVGPAFRASLARVKIPAIALLGALVFVKLIMVEGSEKGQLASTEVIGLALSHSIGAWWQYGAVFLGALGSFFSGSATISALMFSGIQNSIALDPDLNLNRDTILALQSVGGAMGNMVCIHNIVAVCSVVGLKNREGVILMKMFLPLLAYGIIATAFSLILF